jgi:hypothetical protein
VYGERLCEEHSRPEPSVINLATPIPGVVTVNLPKDIPLVVETAEKTSALPRDSNTFQLWITRNRSAL